MLIIQKDFENKLGYSPIYMRPIPIFASGYFQINDKNILKQLMLEYKGYCKIKDESKNIIEINLGYIKIRRSFDNNIEPILLESNNDRSGFLEHILSYGEILYEKDNLN